MTEKGLEEAIYRRADIGFLKQAEAVVPVKELCLQHGFSDVSFYIWRAKFGRMSVPDTKRLRELEAENSRLKKLLTESILDTEGSALGRKRWPRKRGGERNATGNPVSERRACFLVRLLRTVLRYV